MKNPKLILGIGIILFVVAGYLIYSTNEFLKASIEVEGKIIDLEVQEEIGTPRYDKPQTILPIIQFLTSENDTVVFKSNLAVSKHQFGQTVTIRYNKDNPQEARAAGNFMEIWGLGLIVLGVSIIAIVLGLRAKTE